MNDTEKLSEAMKMDIVTDHADITTVRVSAYVPMAHFRKVYARCKTAVVTATKTVTVKILQATDSSGTGAKDLVAAPVFTSPGTPAAADIEMEASASDMDINNGFTHVAVSMLSNDTSALPAAALLVRGGSRVGPVSKVS